MKIINYRIAIYLAILTQAIVIFYPNKRICHWFEFLTDGMMPPVIANYAQDILSNIWLDAFKKDVVQKNNEVGNAISNYFQFTSTNTVIELASGGGSASSLWMKELRTNNQIENATLLLTDLQPNVEAWQVLQHTYGNHVQFIDSSVDATNIVPSVTAANGLTYKTTGSLRMINFALHHFPPELVQLIFLDVIRTKSAIIVGDVAPNIGNLFWMPVIAVKTAIFYRPSLSSIPLPVYAALPLLPICGIHDAIVSTLRAYSFQQLQDIAKDIDGFQDYEVIRLTSGPVSKWLGLPDVSFLGLNEPVVNYFILQPKLTKK